MSLVADAAADAAADATLLDWQAGTASANVFDCTRFPAVLQRRDWDALPDRRAR
jgi:hypothetical protein